METWLRKDKEKNKEHASPSSLHYKIYEACRVFSNLLDWRIKNAEVNPPFNILLYKWKVIVAVHFQFKQLERRSLKKSGLQRDPNPWPPRYRCDALPTELWSHTLGERSIYWVHISREEWNMWSVSEIISCITAVLIWIISYILHTVNSKLYYYMASSASGQDDPNRALWLANRAGKIEPSCPLGTTRCIPQEIFFCEFMDLNFVSVHKQAKNELGQYPAILTSQLVNNPYICNR